MKNTRSLTPLLCCSFLLISAGPVSSAEKDVLSMMSDKQRLERMERLLSPEMLQQQQQQVRELRAEITQLREQLDQQGYELESIKQRQRSLYMDVDRRLSSLEKGSSLSTDNTSIPPPPVASTDAAADVIPATSANSNDPDGKEAYDQAFAMLKDGQYKQSIVLFSQFIKDYPQGKYSDNAQYWLGEASYADRQYTQALNQFQALIARYPDSSKIPGARLKIGYVYYELKNWSAARESLLQVIKLNPGTSMSKKAQERLDRMKREGR